MEIFMKTNVTRNCCCCCCRFKLSSRHRSPRISSISRIFLLNFGFLKFFFFFFLVLLGKIFKFGLSCRSSFVSGRERTTKMGGRSGSGKASTFVWCWLTFPSAFSWQSVDLIIDLWLMASISIVGVVGSAAELLIQLLTVIHRLVNSVS